MGTYVVGDIHGCYDEWIKLKNRIEKMDSNAKFILIGDIVDRGPKVLEMIQWAMKNITPDGKYQMILGNHEDMIIDWWRRYIHNLECIELEQRHEHGEDYKCTIDYRDFGGCEYGFNILASRAGLNDEQVDKIVKFFKRLPLTKDVYVNTENKSGKQHYIICHAFADWRVLNKDESIRKKALRFIEDDVVHNYQVRINREMVLWERADYDCGWLKRSIIIHGHTPILGANLGSDIVEGKACFHYCNINIDCGCVYKDFKQNNLCALRLEDLQEFYLYSKNSKMTQQQLDSRAEMKDFIKGKRVRNRERAKALKELMESRELDKYFE